MFSASAELYDVLYSRFKDYPAETTELVAAIRRLHPQARTVLDVACGTAEHARLLAEGHGFEVDGLNLDPTFVRIARRKLPRGSVRVSHTEIEGRLSRLRFEYLIGRSEGIEHAVEIHELGLFTIEEMLECFRRAGLQATHDPQGPCGRGGLFLVFSPNNSMHYSCRDVEDIFSESLCLAGALGSSNSP